MNFGLRRIAFDELPKHLTRHGLTRTLTTHRDEQSFTDQTFEQDRSGLRHVAHQPLAGDFAKRNQPFFAAFTCDAQHAIAHAQIQQLEPHQLAHPQATGVNQLQHGAITHAQRRVDIGRSQQALDLGFAQTFGHTHGLLGGQELERGIDLNHALTQGPAIKTLEHRQASVGRCGFGLHVTRGEVVVQSSFIGIKQLARARL